MRVQRWTAGIASSFALSAASSGQIVNGDFETGAFPPWVVTPTAGGTSLATAVVDYDIDGPGFFATSKAARFMVGRMGPVATWEGIELIQSVELQATPFPGYDIWMSWSVKPLVNVYNQSGGRFDLIVNGQVIDTAIAPATTGLATAYGFLHERFSPSQSGVYQVGVRITRPVLAGEEVFQYVDNFKMARCWMDCNEDGSQTVADLGCFQTRWVMNDPYADCDQNEAFTVSDFGCARTMFVIGCP